MLPLIFASILFALFAIWPRIGRGRIWRIFALFFVVMASIIHQLAFDVLADDAFISFRYAQNFSDGLGLVFNSGERVEGYSNFLLVMILAGLHHIFHWDIPTVARALGVLSASLTIICVYYAGLIVTESPAWGLIAALLVAASPTFAAYGPSGLETPLFALLLMSVIVMSLRRRWLFAGVLTSFSVMTHPDGVLFIIPCLLAILLDSNNRTTTSRNIFLLLTPIGVILLPWTAWRIAFYGHLLPNAIAAKSGMALLPQFKAGVLYIIDFAIAHMVLIILLAIGVWSAFKRKGIYWLEGANLLLVIFIALIFSFACATGGDWMPGWRFVVPAIPPMCLLVVSLWKNYVFTSHDAVARNGIVGGLVVAGSIACLGMYAVSHAYAWMPTGGAPIVLGVTSTSIVFVVFWWGYLTNRGSNYNDRATLLGFFGAAVLLVGTSYIHPNLVPRFQFWDDEVKGLSEIGRWLNQKLEKNMLVAVLANGALSYYDKLPTIDVVGLTDAHIAREGQKLEYGMPGHISHDYKYVVSRKPAVVILSGDGFAKEPSFEIMPEFRGEYQAVSFLFEHSQNHLGQYVNTLVAHTTEEDVVRRLTTAWGVRRILQ